MKLTEGSLYPALHKMESDGYLAVETERTDGRIRKYYKLTEDGTKESKHKIEELENFIRNMLSIVNIKIK